MICSNTGEFKLDEYGLVIHSDLTLAAFRDGNIVISQRWTEKEHSGVYSFLGTIGGVCFEFWITFIDDKIYCLRFWENVVLYDQEAINRNLRDASALGEHEYRSQLTICTNLIEVAKNNQKKKHDEWLAKQIGTAPPYEYSWGEIESTIDPRDGRVAILVQFKHAFGQQANLLSYFKQRRESARVSHHSSLLRPGELPEGFKKRNM